MLTQNTSDFSKIEKSYLTTIALLVPIFIMCLSGLILTLRFHPSHGTLLEVWGIGRELWREIHIYSAIISTILLNYHLLFVRKRLWKVISSGKSGTKSIKASRNVFWIFAICSISGFVAYISGILDTELHHIVEIHDKIGILLVIITTQHIIYKWKSIVKVSKNRIFNKAGN